MAKTGCTTGVRPCRDETRRLEILLRVAETLSLEHDIEITGPRAVALAREATGADLAAVAVPEGQGLRYRWFDGLEGEAEIRRAQLDAAFGIEHGLAGEVFRTGRPVVIADYRRYPRALPQYLALDVRSAAGVPIADRGEVLGVLSVAAVGRSGAFGPDEVAVLEAIARQLGAALRREALGRELAASEARFRTLFEEAPDAIFLADAEGRFLDLNREAERISGYARAELTGKSYLRLPLVAPAQRRRIAAAHRRVLKGATVGPMVVEVRRADGRTIPIELRARLLRDTDGRPVVLGIARDLSERYTLEGRLRAIAEHIAEGILVVDRQHRILYANPRAADLLGSEPEDLDGSALGVPLRVGRPVEITLGPRRLRVRAAPLPEPGGEHLVVSIEDVTEEWRSRRELERLARTDPLTGLLSRNAFYQELARLLRERAGRPLAVVYLDLEHFGDVNDVLGPRAGDRLLREAGARLQAMRPTPLLVGRHGSDEFVAAFALDPAAATAPQAQRVGAAALAAVQARAYSLGREQVRLGASVGVAVHPEHGVDAEVLVAHADAACQHAHETGPAHAVVFDPAIEARRARFLQTATELATAVEDGALALHYQPVVALATGGVIGVEALVRWPRDGGLVPPAEFIHVAEESGLIATLGKWVLQEAVRQAGAWRARGLDLRCAFNVSARQLITQDLPALVRAALETHDVPPDRLEMELTESSLAHEAERTRALLQRLRALGVRVAVDDFGTGYSSLLRLRDLPASTLKIDRCFVSALPRSRRDAHIIETIVRLAHGLGLEAVAEGVETEAQRRFLEAAGCDLAQGYLFSPPVPADRIPALVQPRPPGRPPQEPSR